MLTPRTLQGFEEQFLRRLMRLIVAKDAILHSWYTIEYFYTGRRPYVITHKTLSEKVIERIGGHGRYIKNIARRLW